MRLRQIALVAGELDPVVDLICGVLGIEVSFNDPGVGKYGLINAVMPLGNTYLEVVAPSQPDTTAGRLLDRRGGDGGYMVIIQVDELESHMTRMESLGVRVVDAVDYEGVSGRHLHPKDVGAAILSLDKMDPPESWKWAGQGWEEKVHTDVVGEIVGVDLQSTDTEALAKKWSDVLDCPASKQDNQYVIQMDKGFVRVVPDTDGRGDGVCGLHIEVKGLDALTQRAADRGLTMQDNSVDMCGTTFHFVKESNGI